MTKREQVLSFLMGVVLAIVALMGLSSDAAAQGRTLSSNLMYAGTTIKEIHRSGNTATLLHETRYLIKDTGHYIYDRRTTTKTVAQIGSKARTLLWPPNPYRTAIMAAILAAGYLIDDQDEEVKTPSSPEVETGQGQCWRGGTGWRSSGAATFVLEDCETWIKTTWPAAQYSGQRTNWNDGYGCAGNTPCTLAPLGSPGPYGHVRVWVNPNNTLQLWGWWGQPIATDPEDQVTGDMELPKTLTDEEIGEALLKNGAYRGLLRRLFTDPRTGYADDPDIGESAEDSGFDATDHLNSDPLPPPHAPSDTGVDNMWEETPTGDPVPDSPFGLGPAGGASSGASPGTGTDRGTGHYSSDDELAKDASKSAPDGHSGDPVDAVTGNGPADSDVPTTDDGTGGEAVKVRLSCEGLNVLACVQMGSDGYIGSTDLPVEWMPVSFSESMVCPALDIVPNVDWSDLETAVCGGFEAARPIVLLVASLVSLLIVFYGITRA